MPSTHRTPTTRSSHLHHMLTALPCKRARALSLSLSLSLSFSLSSLQANAGGQLTTVRRAGACGALQLLLRCLLRHALRSACHRPQRLLADTAPAR